MQMECWVDCLHPVPKDSFSHEGIKNIPVCEVNFRSISKVTSPELSSQHRVSSLRVGCSWGWTNVRWFLLHAQRRTWPPSCVWCADHMVRPDHGYWWVTISVSWVSSVCLLQD